MPSTVFTHVIVAVFVAVANHDRVELHAPAHAYAHGRYRRGNVWLTLRW